MTGQERTLSLKMQVFIRARQYRAGCHGLLSLGSGVVDIDNEHPNWGTSGSGRRSRLQEQNSLSVIPARVHWQSGEQSRGSHTHRQRLMSGTRKRRARDVAGPENIMQRKIEDQPGRRPHARR